MVPFDYSLQAGRSGVHSRVVPSTRHTLGPRDAVRRYLGLVSPVCCGCDVRVEPRSGPLGQDGIDYLFFFTIAPYGAYYRAVPGGCLRPFWLYLLFFVVVIPQMGQLTFHASSSSARSIFIFFHGPTDTSVIYTHTYIYYTYTYV